MLLRMRWEMDRPNLRATMWSGEDYVAAWKYVREIFRAGAGEERVLGVVPDRGGLHPRRRAGLLPRRRPGRLDLRRRVRRAAASRRSAQLMEPFLQWAAQRPKPIMIGEFGVAKAWGSAGRAAWLRDAERTFKANPQIKAVVYFESNPEGNGPNQQFRLTGDPPAFDAFRAMTRDPYFNP